MFQRITYKCAFAQKIGMNIGRLYTGRKKLTNEYV